MKRAILAFVLCAGCARTDAPVDAPMDEALSAGVDSSAPAGAAEASTDPARAAALPSGCEDLPYEILLVPAVRDSLRAQFGEPRRVEARTQPNRHVEGVTDTIFDVSYPGLLVGIHKPGGGGDLPTRVEVEANRYLRYPRIGIGALADSVEHHLGDATDGGPDVLTYSCGEAVEQPVRFELRNGRVSRIVVEYYVD